MICNQSIADIVATDSVETAFTNIDVAILVGAMPRKEGMERKDLLKANARIFESQGKGLDMYAKKTVKVCILSLVFYMFLIPIHFIGISSW